MREMGDWREYLMEQLSDPENAINKNEDYSLATQESVKSGH